MLQHNSSGSFAFLQHFPHTPLIHSGFHSSFPSSPQLLRTLLSHWALFLFPISLDFPGSSAAMWPTLNSCSYSHDYSQEQFWDPFAQNLPPSLGVRWLQTRHIQDHWHSRWIKSWRAFLVQTKFGRSSPQLQKVPRKPEGITVLLFFDFFSPRDLVVLPNTLGGHKNLWLLSPFFPAKL